MQQEKLAGFTISCIIFSYNRPCQLDAYLRSLLACFSGCNLEVIVLIRYEEEFQKGYEIIKECYKNIKCVYVKERRRFVNTVLPKLTNISNIYRAIKYPYRKLRDNFKYDLEEIIGESKGDFIMFGTDDTFFYQRFKIPIEALNMIKQNPSLRSIWLYVGPNIINKPQNFKAEVWGGYSWNFYDPNNTGPWAYPFSVDGAIYEKAFILNFMKKYLYDNPSTLESVICSEIKRKHYITTGSCLPSSVIINFPLNRVTDVTNNYYIGISTNYINKFFLKGYRLNYIIKRNVDNLILKDGFDVILYKDDHTIYLIRDGKISINL